MSKVTHTHRGHCQVCLRVQAIDVTTGLIAKHGYVVRNQSFRGECSGSGFPTLHVKRNLTDAVIAAYRDHEMTHKAIADALEAGTTTPTHTWLGEFWGEAKADGSRYWTGEYHTEKRPNYAKKGAPLEDERVRTMIEWATATEDQRSRQLVQEIETARSEQRKAKSDADMFTHWAKTVHDAKMPAYRNEDLDNPFKVGDTVHVGGEKNGFECAVEALEMQDYTTYGYRQGRQTIEVMHAKVTRPAVADTFHKNGNVKKAGKPSKTWFEPVRNIKPPKGSLLDMLKADGLI